MPLAIPHYTIADLDRFPEDGNRYELLTGTLLVSPAPGTRHEFVLERLIAKLRVYLEPVGLARVLARGVIQVGLDTQLEPDALVIPTHYPDGILWSDVTERWLAVEASGRDSRVYDRDYKRGAYLDIGVREVWRLDLDERLVYVSRPGAAPDLPFGGQLIWHPPEMPAPLTLDVGAVFGALASGRPTPAR